jgi:hypothetical protein
MLEAAIATASTRENTPARAVNRPNKTELPVTVAQIPKASAIRNKTPAKILTATKSSLERPPDLGKSPLHSQEPCTTHGDQLPITLDDPRAIAIRLSSATLGTSNLIRVELSIHLIYLAYYNLDLLCAQKIRHPPPRLGPGKPAADPQHQLIEFRPLALQVYAEGSGHCTIFCCPHTFGSSSGGRITSTAPSGTVTSAAGVLSDTDTE